MSAGLARTVSITKVITITSGYDILRMNSGYLVGRMELDDGHIIVDVRREGAESALSL